jgi:RNA polymerase sigma factor (sigma-70 family)
VTAASTKASRAPRLAGGLLRLHPDRRLANLAGEGSEEAFEELVRRHRSALVRFASPIAPSGSAEDVVQDSFVKAHRALTGGDRPEKPRAWLYRIVRNTALNELRDHRPNDHLDESYDGVEQPLEVAERHRQVTALIDSLRGLPRAQREAIVQRELEGRGHAEIAASLEVSPGAVRQLIFRARETLRAGAAALIPIQLLRLIAFSGATEQVGGAAGTGLGLTAVKVGLGAVLATGAVVTGLDGGKLSDSPAGAAKAVAAVPSNRSARANATSAAENGAADDSSSSPVAAVTTGTEPVSNPSPRQTASGPGPGGERDWGDRSFDSSPPPPTDVGGSDQDGPGSYQGPGATTATSGDQPCPDQTGS